MSAHVRTCAHCGVGPSQPDGGACCWNPTGCGCDTVNARIEGGGTPALAGWIVARDGGRNCVRCDREIRRGEAYELLPGADELAHIHCPHRTKEPTDG